MEVLSKKTVEVMRYSGVDRDEVLRLIESHEFLRTLIVQMGERIIFAMDEYFALVEHAKEADVAVHTRSVEPVPWFVDMMREKLLANAHKGTWRNDAVGDLFLRLKLEVDELERVIETRRPRHMVVRECADVANFAMMIADVMHIEEERTR